MGICVLGVAEAGAGSISDVSKVLFEIAFKAHFVGFIISLIGTQALLARLGTRICLMLIPFSMGAILFYLIFETSPESLRNAFVDIYRIELCIPCSSARKFVFANGKRD